jgi:DNA-binding NarL/FixJ family response regulator
MLPVVVVVSRLHLVRQGIAQRLASLGATVHEYSDASSALQILHQVVPDVMIIDVEDELWSWRPLVVGLTSAGHRVRVVLLARRMGIDEAAEAKHLGVAGIILKPLREEEHMRRLFELMNQVRRVTPRRVEPRFYPEPQSSSMLSLPGPLSTLYRIVNLSVGGARLAASADGLRRMEETGDDLAARLSISGLHVGVSCRVVYREDEQLGIQFRALTSGRLDFREHMGSLRSWVFGPRKVRGTW